jgi:hypothetical protein
MNAFSQPIEWSYCAMTKSFLIKTSVAAIVSAFVFTAGVSSARAWGDSYREASSNRGPLYYPNRDTGGNHVVHYPKRHPRHPYNSYGSYSSHGGYVVHYPKRHPRHPYDSYGSFGGFGGYDSLGSYGGYPRESYDRPGRPVYRPVMDTSWNGGSRYGDNWNGYRGR